MGRTWASGLGLMVGGRPTQSHHGQGIRHCLSGLLLPQGCSKQASLTQAAASSLTLAGGEASGQHRAPSPRPPGLEETSCSREWSPLKEALERGSG